MSDTSLETKNPAKLLHYNCNVGLIDLATMSNVKPGSSTVRGWVHHFQIPRRVKANLFYPTMVYWGEHFGTPLGKALWACYFDGNPHVYHLLHFVFNLPIDFLADRAGMKSDKIKRLLREPTLKQTQLQAIGRFTVEYINALASEKAKDGPDLRYRHLDKALHDKGRIS